MMEITHPSQVRRVEFNNGHSYVMVGLEESRNLDYDEVKWFTGEGEQLELFKEYEYELRERYSAESAEDLRIHGDHTEDQ